MTHCVKFRESNRTKLSYNAYRYSSNDLQRFVPWGMFPRMRTKTSDLITHKDFRVLLMMIGHKSFNKINLLKMRGKKKVALAVELRIYFVMY